MRHLHAAIVLFPTLGIPSGQEPLPVATVITVQ
jgi:hypothetical protein